MLSMLLALIAGLNVYAAEVRDCSLQAESYVTRGYTQPGQFRQFDKDGNLVYIVRVIDQGGDAAYEVIVKGGDCAKIRVRLLWTE
ncbi:MAG: hypothetical protein AB7N80_10230 [Bdellovibrionales bacterium]